MQRKTSMNERSLLHHRRRAHPDIGTEWLLLLIGIVTVLLLAASVWVSFHIPHPDRHAAAMTDLARPAPPGLALPVAPRPPAPEGPPANGTAKP
jgi:hypothetical protein